MVLWELSELQLWRRAGCSVPGFSPPPGILHIQFSIFGVEWFMAGFTVISLMQMPAQNLTSVS